MLKSYAIEHYQEVRASKLFLGTLDVCKIIQDRGKIE